MRPIQLKMNAFGPYRGLVDLDFTDFGASSIFLVTGPTGSGKTTIFDALTYALYNNASGQIREIDMMKSQFATDEDLCFVELTFEIKNETYRIVRSPKQMGPGVRSKVRSHESSVEFYKGEELLGTGTNANEGIVELLGLTYQQFRQIVLLPQGEFRRLLISNSKEKEDIFRNIFGTEEIQAFQEILKEKRAELRKAYQTFETKLEQSLDSIDSKTVDNFEQEGVRTLADAIERKDYEVVLELLDGIIEEENKEFTAMKQAIDKMSKSEKAYETLLQLLTEKEQLEAKKKELMGLANDIEKSQDALARNKNAREVKSENDRFEAFEKDGKRLETDLVRKIAREKEMIEELGGLRGKEKASKKAEAELDSVRTVIKHLETELVKFEEVEQKEKTIEAAETKLKEIAQTMIELHTAEEQLIEEIEILTINIKQLASWREELENTRIEKEAVKVHAEEVAQQKMVLEKIVTLQDELADLMKENKVFSITYQTSQKTYEDARHHYFGNLAGVLATELVASEPCPVCGSLEHPEPTNNDLEAMTEEKLHACEKARDADRTTHTELNAEISQKGTSIKEQIQLLDMDFTAEDGNKNFTDALARKEKEAKAFNQELATVETTIQKIETQLKQEEKWRTSLGKKQQDLQANNILLAQAENSQTNEAEKISENETDIKSIQATLQHESPKEVQGKADELHAQIKKTQKEAERIRTALNEKTNETTEIKTSIKLLGEQLEDNKKKAAEQRDLVADLLEKYLLDDHFMEYILEDNIIQEMKSNIKTYGEEKSYTIRQLEKVATQLNEYEEEQRRSRNEIEADLADIRTQKLAIEEKRDGIIRQLSSHESSHREIKANFKDSKSIYKPLAVYTELAEVANGSNSRTNYVSFERYVLSIYFSEILLAANERFEKMTNNRYELVRREEKTKGQSAEGLEINIFDRYSGKERSVKTLSGGETFKASLALALGLSDVIQSQQGGVQVDTLFIDEGFGTLDSDSLEMAIETLMDLQSTGRLIGIISHVDELKDRIPARIAVENKKEGSHARIEVD